MTSSALDAQYPLITATLVGSLSITSTLPLWNACVSNSAGSWTLLLMNATSAMWTARRACLLASMSVSHATKQWNSKTISVSATSIMSMNTNSPVYHATNNASNVLIKVLNALFVMIRFNYLKFNILETIMQCTSVSIFVFWDKNPF